MARSPSRTLRLAGDKVLAEDPETGEQGFFEVVALTNHPTDEVLQITIDVEDESGDNGNEQLNSTDTEDSQTGTMEITPDHPVYVEDKGWLNAENLEVGDELRRSDGGVAKVLAVERVKLDEPQEVYNFTVKGPHTYFVLSSGVLVHNVSCRPKWDKDVKRWRDPETGRFSKRPEPIQTFDVNGLKIHQYEEDSFWRAVVIDNEAIDESITKHGYQSGYDRGVGKDPKHPLKPEDKSKLAPDAPHEERAIEYVGVKGQEGFPRDANVVGVHSNPEISVAVAKGTGLEKIGKPGVYIRIDEPHISRGDELIDIEVLFETRKLESKFPIKYEFNWDGSIPVDRIINTTRLPLGEN